MIGGRMAALRRSRGWSQAQLASELGISASAVGMYEQGRREPSLEQVVRLATLFGVSTDYLLMGKALTPQETHISRQLLQRLTEEAACKIQKRDDPPFTRQELAMLFAAALLEP